MDRLAVVALVLFGAVACRRPEPPQGKQPSVAQQEQGQFDRWFTDLSPEAQQAWRKGDFLSPLRAAEAVKDRKELVVPVPTGFRPLDAARKIKLTLMPLKSQLRIGEHFWYRVELQNIGKDPIYWYESRSFFKSGEMWANDRFEFYVTPPGGKESLMLGPHPVARRITDIRFPSSWTEQKKVEKIQELNLRQKVEAEIGLTLTPGQVLATKAWKDIELDPNVARDRWIRGEPDPHFVPGKFRALSTRFLFSRPGIYAIRLVFNDEAPPPATEEELKELRAKGVNRDAQRKYDESISRESFGRVESNVVKIEVVP